MASDGCQPMERFMKFKGGSAQKSWAMCPGGSYDASAPGGAGLGAAPPPPSAVPSPVSGYVNGYHPTLPPHPPTRAELAARAAGAAAGAAAGWGGAAPVSGYVDGHHPSLAGATRRQPQPQQQPSAQQAAAPRAAAPPPPAPAPAAPPAPLLLVGGARLPLVGIAGGIAAPAGADGVHVALGAAGGPAPDGAFVSFAVPAGRAAEAAEALRAAGLDRVGLLTVDAADAAAAWPALEALVDAGVAGALGLRDASAEQVERVARAAATAKPAVNVFATCAADAQRRLVGVCRRHGVQVVALEPLGGAPVRAKLVEHPVVKAVAAKTGRSGAAVLAAWTLQRGVAVVVQDEGDAAAFVEAQRFGLVQEDRAAIDGLKL